MLNESNSEIPIWTHGFNSHLFGQEPGNIYNLSDREMEECEFAALEWRGEGIPDFHPASSLRNSYT